jgi:hypothetical protein
MISEFLVYLRLGFEHILDPGGYDHLLFILALTVMYRPRAWRQVVVLVTAFTVGHSATLALATFGRVRVSSEWIEFLIPVTILATAVFNLVEIWWGRRRTTARRGNGGGSTGTGAPSGASTATGAAAGGPSGAATGAPTTVAGGLRGEVREGLRTASRSDWDDALEPSGGRRAKYALALVFGLIHGLGFSNFLRAALGAGAAIAGPLFAFNVGLELGQILIVAVVLGATGLATGPLGWRRRHWVVGLSGATAAVALYIVGSRLPF